MTRRFDDDAPRRLSAAEQHLSAAKREALAEGRELRNAVREWKRDLAHWRSVTRIRWTALAVAVGAFLTGLIWTVLAWDSPTRFVKADIICAAVIVLAAATIVVTTRRRASMRSKKDLEGGLDTDRDAWRLLSARVHVPLSTRRAMYREEVAEIIEQYQGDSRKYRRIHNGLQNLIMIGSAATTTVAALDTGKELTWQNVTIVIIGFAVTLAAAFTGYYKYRERSYFLRQTADAIEEEANALALGVGVYRDFGPDQEEQALALFTERVERERNEQRRRQQELDQPTEQAAPSAQPPA